MCILITYQIHLSPFLGWSLYSLYTEWFKWTIYLHVSWLFVNRKYYRTRTTLNCYILSVNSDVWVISVGQQFIVLFTISPEYQKAITYAYMLVNSWWLIYRKNKYTVNMSKLTQTKTRKAESWGPVDAHMRQSTRHLVKRIIGNKFQWKLDKIQNFHWRKCAWKCCLQNVGIFASGLMC